jgi:hypothetical protein
MTELVRSDEDVMTQAPIVVVLGTRNYEIKVLSIIKARAWRKLLVENIAEIAKHVGTTSAMQQAFFSSFAFIFTQFPEKMADLFFAYATELERERVESEATEEQLALAWSKVTQVALLPFVPELRMIASALGSAETFPALAKSTK